jgi:hypothetical protein
MASTGPDAPSQPPTPEEQEQAVLAARRTFLRGEQAKEAVRESWTDWREPTEAEF